MALLGCLLASLSQALGAVTTRAVTLSWDANTESDVTGYVLRYGTSSGSYTQAVSISGRTTTHATVTTLAINGDYYFVVSAVNGAGEGPKSAEVVTLHNNANLAALAVTNTTLVPSFSSAVQSYTATVPTSTASVELTPTPSDGAATVTVNGAAVPADSSTQVPLVVGTNTVTTVVTAPDKVTKKTNTVKITRAATATVGTFNIGGATFTVNELAGTINIPITRTGGTTGEVDLKFSTTNGTATSPSDFTAVTSQNVKFLDGDGATKNVAIPIANPPVTPELNESFTVTITCPTLPSALGAQKTATVVILDSTDTTPPATPVITAPAVNAKLPVGSGAAVAVTGTVSDNRRVGTVEVSLDAGPFVSAAVTLTGVGAAYGKTASYLLNVVPPVGGAHTIQVRTTDEHGSPAAAMASRTFTVLRSLGVNITGSGSVTAGFAPSSFREIGKSYTITATPTPAAAPGFAFDGWAVSGGPTLADIGVTATALELRTLTFVFREGLVLTAKFIPNPFATTVTGAFNGLILPSSSSPAPGGSPRSNETVGKVTASVFGTGAFSGTLFIDGMNLGFAGVFDNTGTGRFGTNRATTFTVVRTTKPSYLLTLHLDLAPGGTNKMTGSLTQMLRNTVESVSNLDADRAFYNGTTVKVPSGLAGTSSKAYTLAFPAKPLGSQPTGFTLADYPQGDGYATGRVYTNGTVSIVGKLADGTVVSASAPLSKANTWPLFQPLYPVARVTKGCIAGQITLTDASATSVDMTGTDLLWFRPFQLVQWYPYGWPEGIKVDLMGARYTVPPATPPMSVFPGPGPSGVLKQPADLANGNVGATFSDGLLSGSITRNVKVSPTNVATRPTTNTDTSFTMLITSGSGLVSGIFTHTDGTKPAYLGVIIQKGTNRGAYGYFLTKQPAVIDYKGESGGVTAIAK